MARGSLLTATRSDVQDWLDGLAVTPATVRVYLSHLRAFYAWAQAEGLLRGEAPTLRIPLPRRPQYEARPIDSADLHRAVSNAPTIRLRSWLLLACLQGLRAMEIAGMERSWVREGSHELYVLGKGNQERTVPLHPWVLAALLGLPMPRRGRLFLNPNGSPVQPWRVSQDVNRYLHAMGIAETCHSLRHWFATRIHEEAEFDLPVVSQLLGHRSIATTQVYVKRNDQRARDAVRRLRVIP